MTKNVIIRNLPYVLATTPVSGAYNVPTTSPITIIFSKEMNTTSVEAAISSTPDVTSTASFSWSADKKTATITPSSPGLTANTNYTVTVSDYAKDAQGNQLDGDKDGSAGGNYTFSFSTKSANIKITDLAHEYADGGIYWVKAGTKTVTVQLVDNSSNPILTNTPPQLTWTSPSGSVQPVNFGSSETSTLTWTGTISITSGMNGQATFTSASGMPASGITSFMIDTKPPDIGSGSSSTPGCPCPQSPLVFKYEPTDSGSGLGVVVPVGLGLEANGCYGPGSYQFGASKIADKVGNETSFTQNVSIGSPPGCDHPDDNYVVSGSSLPTGGDTGQSSGVFGLREGYHLYFFSLLNKVNQGVTLKDLGDLTPDMAGSPGLLVIPSAGLYGLENSQIFKSILDEFVKQGGTLLVFAQQHGYEYSALPTPDGKPIAAYGWTEDQSCQYYSSYIDTWHQMLSSISQATPSINVDGYFTSYPSDATVLLRRTANGQPSVIMYPYGNGRVIATAVYSDFAYGYGQASLDEIALVRDMITWAKAPAQLPEVKGGNTLSVSLPVTVTNNTASDAASVRLLLYNPDRTAVLSEQTMTLAGPAGQTAQASVSYTSTSVPALGIYHTDYVLLDV